MLKIFNTWSRKIEEFHPIRPGQVGMYSCGLTVYDYDHLGHAWNYTSSDLLQRVLELDGYQVKLVMNLTDVGHLTSDADEGEDKMEKSAHKHGKTAWEIADYYAAIFLANRDKLNLRRPEVICKATDNIKEMIDLVQVLIDKGYAYEINDGIYFDTSKFGAYGRLSGNTLENLKEGARVEINAEKRQSTDFALWKFSSAGEKRQLEWSAFGRLGFPGWHIECSAMSMKYLGPTFDIHTGGEDLIFPHHEDEIAQSEAATGVKFCNYWFHVRFLMIEGEKMSKSKKNFYRLTDIEDRGYEALDLRYLFLTAHYRSQLNFTWASLEGAKIARKKLNDFLSTISDIGRADEKFSRKFLELVNDDLALPQATAMVWEVIKSNLSPEDKKATILYFDRVLGLKLDQIASENIPEEVDELARQRQSARNDKDFGKSDSLREQIKRLGYEIEDAADGYKLKKI